MVLFYNADRENTTVYFPKIFIQTLIKELCWVFQTSLTLTECLSIVYYKSAAFIIYKIIGGPKFFNHKKEVILEQQHKRHPDRVPKDFSVRNLISEEPPPEAFKRRTSSKWGPITNALKKTNPGKWYRLQSYEHPKSASSAATTLRRLYRGQGFEFVHHEGKLYGRYVGNTSEKVATSTGRTTTTTHEELHTELNRRIVG